MIGEKVSEKQIGKWTVSIIKEEDSTSGLEYSVDFRTASGFKVSTYLVNTLLEDEDKCNGICMMGFNPEYILNAEDFRAVCDYIRPFKANN